MAAKRLTRHTVSLVIDVEEKSDLLGNLSVRSRTVDVTLYAENKSDAEARFERRLQALLGDEDVGFSTEEEP